MEEIMGKLVERIKILEAHQKETGEELVTIIAKLMEMEDKNEKLKVENDCLKKQIKEKVETVQKGNEEMKANVKDVEMRQNKWLNECKFEEESLKKIIEQQENEKQNLRQKVVNVIKGEKKIVRDTVEKYKQVIVFGLKEEKIVSRIQREEKEKKMLNKLLKKVTDEDSQVVK